MESFGHLSALLPKVSLRLLSFFLAALDLLALEFGEAFSWSYVFFNSELWSKFGTGMVYDGGVSFLADRLLELLLALTAP